MTKGQQIQFQYCGRFVIGTYTGESYQTSASRTVYVIEYRGVKIDTPANLVRVNP